MCRNKSKICIDTLHIVHVFNMYFTYDSYFNCSQTISAIHSDIHSIDLYVSSHMSQPPHHESRYMYSSTHGKYWNCHTNVAMVYRNKQYIPISINKTHCHFVFFLRGKGDVNVVYLSSHQIILKVHYNYCCRSLFFSDTRFSDTRHNVYSMVGLLVTVNSITLSLYIYWYPDPHSVTAIHVKVWGGGGW